jgi:hypothetical protein
MDYFRFVSGTAAFYYSVVLAKRWPYYLAHLNQTLLVGMAF